MATYAKNVNTFTDYGAEAQDIERRRKMAEMLQQQSMQPIEQQAGVPVSWTQGLAKLLQGYNAGQGMRAATEESKSLAGKRNQALAAALGGMPTESQQAMAGSQSDVDQYGMAPQTKAVQPSMQQNAAWLGQLAQIGPDATQIGGTLLGMQQKGAEADEMRKFRQSEAELTRQARRQEIESRLASERMSDERQAALRKELKDMDDKRGREIAQMQIDSRRDLAQFAVNNRPPVQPVQPQIVQTENGPMQVDRSGRAQPIVGPDGQPVRPKSTERALPTSAAQKLMENQQNLRRAEQALSLVSEPKPGQQPIPGQDPNATGWKGYVPDFALQRLDPKGVQARAAVSDIGSLVIHDRSGAAVTASEFPRLRPFIPRAEDDPATARKKLERFVQEYRAVVDEAADFYQQSGYKVPKETLRGSGASGAWQVVR